LEGTFPLPLTIPAAYKHLAALVYRRYSRLKFVGAPLSPIQLGEAVIGQAFTAARNPHFGYEIGHLQDDIASETPGGEIYSVAQSRYDRRTFGLMRDHRTLAQFQEARDEIFRRSKGRVHPLVIVPDSTLDDVIHGRRSRNFRVLRSFLTQYSDEDLTVAESPFASTAS
jgi:hypothetical protein